MLFWFWNVPRPIQLVAPPAGLLAIRGAASARIQQAADTPPRLAAPSAPLVPLTRRTPHNTVDARPILALHGLPESQTTESIFNFCNAFPAFRFRLAFDDGRDGFVAVGGTASRRIDQAVKAGPPPLALPPGIARLLFRRRPVIEGDDE